MMTSSQRVSQERMSPKQEKGREKEDAWHGRSVFESAPMAAAEDGQFRKLNVLAAVRYDPAGAQGCAQITQNARAPLRVAACNAPGGASASQKGWLSSLGGASASQSGGFYCQSGPFQEQGGPFYGQNGPFPLQGGPFP